ncbi:Uncharacterized protein APZ42_005652, partial [Daphnia magna]
HLLFQCSGPTFLIGWTQGRAISQRKVLHVSRWGRRNSTRPFNMKVELDICQRHSFTNRYTVHSLETNLTVG